MPPITSRLVLHNTAASPLGRLSIAGFIKDSAGVESPRVLGSYALVYLLEGHGRYRDPSRSFATRAGDLLLLFPDVPHTYGPGPGQRWSEFYIVFDGPAFDLWRKLSVISPTRPCFHLRPMAYWLKRLEACAAAAAHAPAGPDSVCRLQQLLCDVLDLADRQPAADSAAWLQRARMLLAVRDPERPDLAQVARRMGLSPDAFRKRFTQLAGISPMRYRMQCTIEQAARLLQQPDLPLSAIARACGLCDAFHLSRRFKQIMGMPPDHFRRQIGVR